MNSPAPELRLTVVSRDESVPGAVVFEFEAAHGQALPEWQPGAHIDVILPDGLVRQYSLCGTPGAERWRLGVLRESASRGGSAWIVDSLMPGMTIAAAGPRNHFAFAPSEGSRAIFVAGGIGITPIAAMAAETRARGLDYELHYAGREGRMILREELRQRHGERLVEHVSERGTRLDLAALLVSLGQNDVIYCCGPLRLIDDLEKRAEAAGIPFHAERFEAEPLEKPVRQEAFDVELTLSGMTLTVEPQQSVLDVLEDAGVFVLSSCREGTCGTCETPVVSGEIDHRDSILSPGERARGDRMYVCVSRAACPKLVLEL